MDALGGSTDTGALMYCPECRHEVFLERARDVNCGKCHIMYGRRVAMFVDRSAGDLSKETEKPEQSGLWTP